MVFMVKNLRKRTELLAVDVVKENNMPLCLFHPTLLALTSVFLSEMMLKTMIIVAKIQRTQGQPMMRCKRTLYHQQAGKDKNVDENQPSLSLRHSEWLSDLEKPTVEPYVSCSKLEGYKFIHSNVLNELISNKLCCQCKSNSLQFRKTL